MKAKTLIVTTEKRFYLNIENDIVDRDNTRSRAFWKRYLTVFDKIIIVARVDKETRIENFNYVESNQIMVYPLTNYQGLVQGILTFLTTTTEITSLVKNEKNSFFLLRGPGSIGNILGSILRKNKLQYSVEVVGDPFEVFITQKGLLSYLLAYKERISLMKTIRYAKSVSYVTQFQLQRRYPFKGGYQSYYSSIELNSRFFVQEKEFASKPLTLIGIGNLEMPYKGVGVLLKALKVLADSKINFTLMWIGDGKLLPEYKKFVYENKLSDKVRFVGSISNEEIPNYLNKSNVFIMPSLTEGLPRALIEAMASRLICLGSNVGGIPELLDEECLFPTNDYLAIAEKLKEVHSNFSHYKRYSELNYKKASEYLPEILEERRNNFYKSII